MGEEWGVVAVGTDGVTGVILRAEIGGGGGEEGLRLGLAAMWTERGSGVRRLQEVSLFPATEGGRGVGFYILFYFFCISGGFFLVC